MKKAVILGMAYFSCTVGAGFASGQEMLQYYAAFGGWGIIGAVIALVLMPLIALIAMQYGSYFQATSHDRVFTSVTSKVMARFIDYTITFTQFCISFVMLAGAGANLNQQFGTPLWFGSALMAVAVIICGFFNVEKVTNILGSITPFIVVLLVIISIHSYLNPPADIGAAFQFAQDNVSTTLPNWWVSTFNYVGIAMMGGISMGIIMGGDMLDLKTAGRGGMLGGLLFGILLVMMVIAVLFNSETVYDSALPTLSLITAISQPLGTFAALVIYVMIFSTALGNFYSLSRRVVAKKPQHFLKVLVLLVIIGFALSFLDFATLVGWVFPVTGYLALVMIVVLIWTWLSRGRSEMTVEMKRRDKIRNLALRMIDPKQKFTTAHRRQLSEEIMGSNLAGKHLEKVAISEAVEELSADADSGFDPDEFTPPKSVISHSSKPVGKDAPETKASDEK
ncbi:YkvI family membrane protein [Corynebacterium ammoniagenes]|uniref:Membrane protein YkvI n=1 Tax=Corynebacterium ammoniagenes DSM 20306 TaxID=649754 RepID=A0ABN0AGH9_CORAM|nr:hypothetical protein [Corynebacterium ammoniagenes]AQS74100.1 hypothetical protein CA40472_09440 [Corynebacterium ammoniagenes]EFG82004.1 hypothetical protein HMPREF0281_00711 [Corynebacterium ammoniagenes DSM 20306]